MVLNSEPFGAASAPVASFESGEPLSPENIAEALEDFTDISSPDQVDNVPELISGESPESYIQLPSWSETEVNPLYADVFTPDDLRSMVPAKDSDAATEASESVGAGISWYSDEKSAVADLRDHMVNRVSSIQIGYRSKTEIDAAFVNRISGLAMEHTGKPKEGDSLYSCWQGMNYGVSDYRKEGSEYVGVMTFTMYWYTTAEQERELDGKVREVIEAMHSCGAVSEYEKLYFIYRHICDNVTYDYVHLNEAGSTGYKLHYTAYAALINKTAVCQGYSALLYRLALEAGVDCRIISGFGNGGSHAWNIVRIGNRFYNADTTWDAGKDLYDYFLKCDVNFADHVRKDEYKTTSFYANYPMASKDYAVPSAQTFTENGLVYEIFLKEAKLTGYTGQPTVLTIPSSVRGYAVTTIAGDAFCGCTTLQEMIFPASLKKIEDGPYAGDTAIGAFANCQELKRISFEEPSSLKSIGDRAFFACVSLEEALIPEGTQKIGNSAFSYCYGMKKADLPHSLHQLGVAAFWGTGGLIIVRSMDCDFLDIDYGYGTDGTIYGYKGSTAEGYASSCGIPFQYIEGEGHVHVWDSGKVIRQATCTAEGLRQLQCQSCGAIKEEPAGKTEHVFGKWETVRKATVLAAGEKQKVCSACGFKQTRAIAKLKATWKLASKTLTMKKGKTISKKMISGLAGGDSVKSWKSSKKSVVTVSGNKGGKCKLKARKAGKSTITAKLASGATIRFTVTVK